jgi:hypothetical protein
MAAGDDMRVTGASTLADSKANALSRAVTLADFAICVALRIRAAATVASAGTAQGGPLSARSKTVAAADPARRLKSRNGSLAAGRAGPGPPASAFAPAPVVCWQSRL